MAYKYIAKEWAKPEESFVEDLMKQRLILYRKQPTTIRIEKPTRLDRARSLGYKAKQGYVVARTRIRRGGLRKKRPKAGRRPKRMGVAKFKPAKSLKLIAEERTGKKFPNLEVLNSYWVGEDGRSKWFEVIMVNKTVLSRQHNFKTQKAKRANQNLLNLANQRGRANRGLTASGKRVRNLVKSPEKKNPKKRKTKTTK
ncbi:MAG: 50S ribosomal protein L15e [Candidatus Bathyarchaeota archaeon]|jgi:large subunit ribosomal protein L15e|nr:50S ribosomal protein L15e [Candidatus Bathyarchaeota archaeon]